MATPPAPMKSHLWMAALILLVLIGLGAVLVEYAEGGYVTITSVKADIVYPNGATSGFLGPASQVLSSSELTGRAAETYFAFTLGSYAPNSTSHTILSVSTDTPGFAVTSVSPDLPYALDQGSSVHVGVTLTTGFSGSYDGNLTLVITVE